MIFSGHSKEKIEERKIPLDNLYLAVRNISSFPFIEGKKILFKNDDESFIFGIDNNKLVVITAIDAPLKDEKFDGDIIFKEKDGHLYYYVT